MTSQPQAAGAPRAEMSHSARHHIPALPDGLALGASPGNAPWSRSATARRVELLARTLESAVIPRLVLARREAAAPDYAGAAGPSAEDVRALLDLTLAGDLPGALGFVAVLRARGVALERIYLEALAPVARELGEMWLADACSFTTVTVGLCCLQQVVLENHAAFGVRQASRGAGRRVLLSPVPGEQHGFGILLVGEFFRRQGWEVCSGTGASARELVATVRKGWFGIVGLSLSCEDRLEPLAALIHDMRRATRNPDLGVMVGGSVFLERPELATLVGADATATDAQSTVLKAETLLALLSGAEDDLGSG